MKIGIMQPYFLPYIGYWQLMNAVDKYVIYDDVNYIKGGWINRNRILLDGKVQYINVPMLGASSFKLIKEIGVNTDQRVIDKTLRLIESAYAKAPFFDEVYPVIKSIYYCGDDNLSSFLIGSIRKISKYLGIKTEFIISSEIEKDNNLRGQAKVLAICKQLGAEEYYNAIGGRHLYSFSDFNEKGIALRFLEAGEIKYKQNEGDFYSNLSILDVMMYNSVDDIREFMKNYRLHSK